MSVNWVKFDELGVVWFIRFETNEHVGCNMIRMTTFTILINKMFELTSLSTIEIQI